MGSKPENSYLAGIITEWLMTFSGELRVVYLDSKLEVDG